jgi:hypothetical protein
MHLPAPGRPTDYVFRAPAGGRCGSTSSAIACGCLP